MYLHKKISLMMTVTKLYIMLVHKATVILTLISKHLNNQ